ncbi:flavin reductase [Fertoebacter nigrum]|uniref:Flavin reductase n=1 Tax=Fertoeibacter niger TaxID=2656921 RepID=A0A8X8GWU8_9RHOB|nr:LysR substrate-binding domain-containing protein [Fertoeibacter niger]NUB45768.1 flavin reductase [Fertoeibacter niger]
MMEQTASLRDRFLAGMSQAAATVNIITTDGAHGRAGVTVSAMSSVSADTTRPTLLVCVHHLSPAATLILGNGTFCVNVLRDDQSFIADTFAGRFRDQVADKFDCTQWVTMPGGAPRAADPLVAFDCTVTSSQQVGTHYVFIGEVQAVHLGTPGSPLIYTHRSYGSPERIDGASSIAAGRQASARRLSVGCFHTFGPHILPEMIRRLTDAAPDMDFSLVEGDQRRVQESLLAGESDLALLYDLGLSPDLETIPLIDLPPYVLLAEPHPLATRAEITPEDLRDLPMILLNAPPSRYYFPGILRAAGVEPRIAHRSASFEMVRGLVAQGLGYALLATRPATMHSYDGRPLVMRPLACDAPPSRIVLAQRRGTTPSPMAEHFLWFCRDHFALDA